MRLYNSTSASQLAWCAYHPHSVWLVTFCCASRTWPWCLSSPVSFQAIFCTQREKLHQVIHLFCFLDPSRHPFALPALLPADAQLDVRFVQSVLESWCIAFQCMMSVMYRTLTFVSLPIAKLKSLVYDDINEHFSLHTMAMIANSLHGNINLGGWPDVLFFFSSAWKRSSWNKTSQGHRHFPSLTCISTHWESQSPPSSAQDRCRVLAVLATCKTHWTRSWASEWFLTTHCWRLFFASCPTALAPWTCPGSPCPLRSTPLSGEWLRSQCLRSHQAR